MDINIVPDDVVISGIAGSFPKSKNFVDFKQRLYENQSLLETRFPNNDLNVCPLLGVIDSDHFDNSYFGIHRQQCMYMDPMHRLCLERTYGALVDAGLNPLEVKGKRIGVFMGSTIGENDNLFMESVASGFGVTGHSRAMMPNRISYWLNLKGPSVAYDCNWVTGMEILRLAYIAIKTGQCDSVIIGTANVSVHPEFQWLYKDMGLLSDDGSTRAFDANASGYGRSEGVVVMYIQRASEARRSYASIQHIATRFDGTHGGNLLNIEEKGIVEFLEEFYQKSPVKPEDIEYVETYGCGRKAIDKVELNALEKILCQNRKNPLLITSVKTITGHSEASACLFSIAQAIVALEKEVIPATIQYETPNPEIPGLTNGSFEVVTENKKWSSDYAAVNVIGLDSYFGHCVLKRNPKKKTIKESDIPTLLVASTRTEEGIAAIIETLKTKPKDPEYYKLVQDVFSKPIQGHLQRGYLLFSEEGPKQETIYYQGNKRPIWFVYSGMGSQWCKMLGDFMKVEVFAKSIQKSHAILATKGLDLMNIISTSEKTIYDTILNCFVGIAAMQIALTDLIKSLGIEPDGIIGHSVGELGCAYADGCMTAEQMILAAYCRGMASIEVELIKGMMAAIGLGYDQIKSRLPPTIEVACHNSSESCTISGPAEDMEKFVKQLQDEGVFARLVNVADIAYHSRYIKPAAPLLLKYLKEVVPTPMARSSKWISTSNPESTWDSDLAKHSSPEYHTNNLLSSVLFEEGCKHIPEDAILIEIAPHGLLQAILKRSMKKATNVPLTQRGCKSSLEFLLTNLGKLYLSGLDMDLSALYPKIEYPVSRNTESLTDLVYWNHADVWTKGEDTSKSGYGIKDIMITLSSEQFRDCVGHQLDESYVLPVSYYLDILFQCTDNVAGGRVEVIYENLFFRRPLFIPKSGFVPINAMVHEGSGEFEIYSNEDLLLTGKMIFPIAGDEFVLDKAEVDLNAENVQLTRSDFYNEMQHRGHKYSGMFKTLKNLTVCEDGTVSTVEWKSKWTYLMEAMFQQQLFLAGERNQEIHVPKFIQKVALSLSLLPLQKSEVDVTFEYATSIISTDGIQISGMTTIPLDSEDHSRFDGIEYIPLDGTYTKIESGIDFAIQLTLADYIGQDEKVYLFLTELKTESPLTKHIENVLDESDKTQISFTSVEEVSRIIVHPTHPQLFIVNGPVSDDIVKLTLSSGASLLTKADKKLLSNPTLIQVAQFRVGVNEYVILKKVVGGNTRVINVKGDTLSTKDLRRSSLSWVAELHAAVGGPESKKPEVFLVTTLVPTEGFLNFVQELRSSPNTENLRVIFNLDKKPFDIKLALQRDIPISILNGGVWCTYLPFLINYKDKIERTSTLSILENETINYISVNLKDETLNPATEKRNEVGNIDYSGVNKNGEPVMGLARLDKDSSKLVPDPLLSWPVPEQWSLLDGVSVPHAYTSAYYMLMTIGRLKAGDTVLVHAGCSPIGLAAISIAYNHGCFVYTTVSNDQQKAYIRSHYSFMRDSTILSSEDFTFHTQLMTATSGKGAEVILNCLSGALLHSSLSCIADYGRFIQYGKYDCEEGNSIGMYCFLRNPSFYVVDLEDIFDQPKEVKEEIRKLVTEGIDKFIVRPLPREVVTRSNVENMLGKLKDSANIGKLLIQVNDNFSVNRLNVKRPNKFICNSKQSYLVYGGSPEVWSDVTEWLVFRGARKIIISVDSKPQQNYINRRLSLLQTHFDANIIMAPSKAHTKEGAAELLSEVYTLAPVHLIITLPNKTTGSKSSDTKPVQYLDNALRTTAPKAVLVNFINSAAGICYMRAEAGFATCNIQVPKHSEISDGLSILDGVLSTKISNALVKKNQSDQTSDGSQGTIKDLGKVIPTIEEIIREQKNATQEPDVVQVISEGPLEIRELSPVFIVPGMTGHNELEGMVEHLLFPTFVTVLPATFWPIEKLAEVYAKKMRAIYPRGVFNIISVSSGGALAIEIARVLQKENASLHLFFIDSAPRRIQQALKELGENRNDQGLNLLKRVFDIKDTEVIRKLESIPDWGSKIKMCLEGYEGTKRSRNLLEAGLLRLQDQIDAISAYQPSEVLVSGRIHLIVPDDSNQYDKCGLELYCQNPPNITLVPGNHLSIIPKQEVTDYINRNEYLI